MRLTMKLHLRFLLTLLLPLGLMILTIAAFGAPTPKPLAVVNGEAVTGADLRAEFTARHGGHEKFLLGEAEAKKFLDVVIDVKLLVQEAYRLELDQQKDIARSTNEVAEQKSVEHLVKVEIEEKAQPTPEQIKDAWATKTVMLYRAREIVTLTRAEADAAYVEALKGDFEAVAARCSIAPTKNHGGNLPFVAWGSMEAAWEDAVFALQPGEIARPVKTHQGWNVVQLVETKSVERPDFDKAKLKIDGILKRRALEERKKALSAFLWEKYGAKRTAKEISFEDVKAAAEAKSGEALASWTGAGGGKVVAQELLPRLDAELLASLTPSQASDLVAAELRRSVDEPLAAAEAKARKYEEVPDIAYDVKRHREKLMLGALYADYILKDVKVTDEDVKAYYDAHLKELTTPEKRRVSHIVVATEAEAKDVKKKLDLGEGFADLVKAKSQDTATVKQAGDLGFITAKDVPPDFKAILDLKLGEVSEPVKTKFGWHLIKVTKIEPPRPMAFAEAKDDIKKKLTEDRNREKRAAWVKQLRAASKIKVNESGIQAFLKEAGIN